MTATTPHPSAAPLLPRPAQVAARRQETRDTVTLTVRMADAAAFRFAPGQFAMLYAFGAGEVPISISGDPGHTGEFVVTIRAVGAATRRLTALPPGAALGVRGPYGSSWPVADAGLDVVLMAGGIGMAPLRPLLYRLLAERSRYRRLSLLYGARTPADLLYLEQLRAWHAAGVVDLYLTVDATARGWDGHVGVVTAQLRNLPLRPDATVAYVCGPEVMIRFAALDLLQRRITAQRLFVSLERNMQCAVGWCGHCQLGAEFLCTDGPVYPFARVAPLLAVREL